MGACIFDLSLTVFHKAGIPLDTVKTRLPASQTVTDINGPLFTRYIVPKISFCHCEGSCFMRKRKKQAFSHLFNLALSNIVCVMVD